MRYFMHLKFEGLWKYVLLLPTAILACGLPLALAPDIALHYYTPEHSLYGAEELPADHSDHAGDGAAEAAAPATEPAHCALIAAAGRTDRDGCCQPRTGTPHAASCCLVWPIVYSP